YGKAWRDAIVGRPGLTELEDLAKVHDTTVRLDIVDPKRTILSGASWGGYLTLLGLGVQPERWSLGIGVVPIGDYVAAFEDEMEPLKRYDAARCGPPRHRQAQHRALVVVALVIVIVVVVAVVPVVGVVLVLLVLAVPVAVVADRRLTSADERAVHIDVVEDGEPEVVWG